MPSVRLFALWWFVVVLPLVCLAGGFMYGTLTTVVTVLVLLVLACGNTEPTSTTPAVAGYDCHRIAYKAMALSKEQDEPEFIEKIYRLEMTVDTDTLRECRGESEWSNGRTKCITVWLEEPSVWGDARYGYETC